MGNRQSNLARQFIAGSALVSVAIGGMAMAQSTSGGPAFLEEITVTAQKRSETLQSVPMSIKALTDAELVRSGAQTFSDLAWRIPALSFRSPGPGRQKLTLRGISSASGAPTVSFYLNEAPLAAASSAANTSFQQGNVEPNLFDIDRIEVLRGPQGTLYGASSMGGTVKVVTKAPNLDEVEAKINGQVSTTKEGGENWAANAAINLPLIEGKAALRVTGSLIENDGFIDRVIGDFDHDGRVNGPLPSDVTFPSRTPNPDVPVRRIRDVNTEEVRSIRAALRFDPTDNLSIQPSVFFQRTRQDGKSSYDEVPGLREQRRNFDIPEPYEDEFLLANLTVDYDFGGVSLISSTSYLDRDIHNVEDFTDLMSYFFGYSSNPDDLPAQRRIIATGNLWDLSTPPFPATVQPFPAQSSETVANEDFTQEFRLSSNDDGRLQWIFGLYFKNTKGRAGYNFVIPGYSDAFPAWRTILGGTFGDTFAIVNGRTEYKEYAVFGEATYAFTERLEVKLGARWFDYKNSFDRSAQGLFFGTPVPSIIAGEATDNGINPKVLLSYEYSDDAQVYGTVAKGYRPGAGNAPIPVSRCGDDLARLGLSEAPLSYGPDQLWSYEIGSKSRLFGGRATVNAAVYYIDWTDVQQRIVLPTCGANYIDNAGSAKSRGFELEFDALVTQSLRLSGGVGYTKATFKEGAPFSDVEKGDRLLDAPEWTLNFSGEYMFTVLSAGDAYARASWSYVDSSLDVKGIEKAAYDILDLRVGLALDSWELAVFAHNVLDETAELTKVDTIGQIYPSLTRVATNRPRTIGLSVTKNF